MTKNIFLGIMVVITALSISMVFAAETVTRNIEIRVWENANDAESNYISARPEGGSWRTLGTIPFDKDESSSTDSGRFRYWDITLPVSISVPEPVTVVDSTEIDLLKAQISGQEEKIRILENEKETLTEEINALKSKDNDPVTCETPQVSSTPISSYDETKCIAAQNDYLSHYNSYDEGIRRIENRHGLSDPRNEFTRLRTRLSKAGTGSREVCEYGNPVTVNGITTRTSECWRALSSGDRALLKVYEANLKREKDDFKENYQEELDRLGEAQNLVCTP